MEQKNVHQVDYRGAQYPIVRIRCKKGKSTYDTKWLSNIRFKNILLKDIVSTDEDIRRWARNLYYKRIIFYVPHHILLGPSEELLSYLFKHLYGCSFDE